MRDDVIEWLGEWRTYFVCVVMIPFLLIFKPVIGLCRMIFGKKRP